MNKVMNLFDGVTPRDATTLNTSIDIRCLETGEVIFKGLKNKVVVAGSGLIAHSLFDIESGEVTPSYDSKIPGFVNITDPAPDSSPINETSATKSNPKVVLFCCGIDGCGTENSQVYPVDYTSWIKPENLIPFRFVPENNDSINGPDNKTYFGRSKCSYGATNYNAYYFKTFSSTVKIIQQYATGDPINSDLYDNDTAKTGESYVEISLKITKDELREYFNNSSNTSLGSARINSISLCYGYPTIAEDRCIYYRDIRPFTKLNFPNQSLIDETMGIEIIYHIYM